ncbi:MAG: AEC family transporter [Anaerolineae bacterium]|nr:AEC family transporter [Anaerolineae bacterium]
MPIFGQFLSVFVDVTLPVFALVLVGYLAGPRLGLEARTLSRAAYFLFIPAFVFHMISESEVEIALVFRMVVYMSLVLVACAVLGFATAKLLGESRKISAAFVLVAVFANVGNFGLSLVEFRLGQAALVPGTIYFLAVAVMAFVISIIAAGWVRGGGIGAATSVMRTPALIAVIPALFFSITHTEVPLFVSRSAHLLGSAMIPTLLVTLGVQLAAVGKPRIGLNVIAASAVRLVGGPILAALLIIPFGFTGLERSAGILQASMPTGVTISIIAIEYDLAPDFVTTTILFSTLASLITLTFVLLLV